MTVFFISVLQSWEARMRLSVNASNIERTEVLEAVRLIRNKQSPDVCSISVYVMKYGDNCYCICWMHKICEAFWQVEIVQEAWSKDTHNYAVKKDCNKWQNIPFAINALRGLW